MSDNDFAYVHRNYGYLMTILWWAEGLWENEIRSTSTLTLYGWIYQGSILRLYAMTVLFNRIRPHIHGQWFWFRRPGEIHVPGLYHYTDLTMSQTVQSIMLEWWMPVLDTLIKILLIQKITYKGWYVRIHHGVDHIHDYSHSKDWSGDMPPVSQFELYGLLWSNCLPCAPFYQQRLTVVWKWISNHAHCNYCFMGCNYLSMP